MRDYTYTLTADGFGDELSDPVAAADRWNRFIAPVLRAATTPDMISKGDEPRVFSLNALGRSRSAREWALEIFCGNSDVESARLANELEDRLK